MKKLELKDICGYLPYELKVIRNGFVGELLSIKKDSTITCSCSDWFENIGDNNPYKPILRPLSDLYKPIIHHGEEIVPIVELAKIAGFKDCTNAMRPNRHGEYFALSDEGHFKFAYLSKDCAFAAQIGVMILQTAKNQYQLFDYLHELKIDYRGLIDAGLAISVHDLEFNPYN